MSQRRRSCWVTAGNRNTTSCHTWMNQNESKKSWSQFLLEKQVDEDKKNNTDENGEYEITKENRMLQEKYDELLKGIEDKSKLMETQLKEKETGIETIES